MLTGMNTEIQYRGETYHVQTEDGGAARPVITTLLFKEGTILLSKKTNYADRSEEECSSEAVKNVMKEQHKIMLKDLVAGRISLPSSKEGSSVTPLREGPR